MEHEESKKGSDWLIVALGLVLLGYTGYRTLDVIALSLPPENWWIGLFALVALDAGVLAWTYYRMHHAQSLEQERIATIMITLCLGGVGFALFGDTFYQISKRGFDMARNDVAFWAVVVQSAIVFANVVACVIVPMISPAAQLIRQRRRIYHNIQAQTLFEIEKRSQILAGEAAQVEGEHWLAQERAKYRAKEVEPSKPLKTLPTFSADGGGGGDESEGDTKTVNFTRRGRK